MTTHSLAAQGESETLELKRSTAKLKRRRRDALYLFERPRADVPRHTSAVYDHDVAFRQERELDAYLNVGSILELLRAKARLSLKKTSA